MDDSSSEGRVCPGWATHEAAVRMLEELFPEGEECNLAVFDTLQFIEPCDYLESVRCPACSSVTRIDFESGEGPGLEFWMETGERLQDENASDMRVSMPCSQAVVLFASLTFECPAAFARFELKIRNPNDDLGAAELSRLETILGCKLTLVRARY